MGSVTTMRKALRSLFAMPPRFEATKEWTRMVKRIVARYARGNIAVQNERILMPEEQAREREEALNTSKKWKERYRTTSC
jgi:hypothetical protein